MESSVAKMGRKKAFDKKTSVTFQLVHRSQRDPLAADETAPQMVFVDKNDDNKRKEEQKKYGIYFDDDYNYLQHLRDVDQTSELVAIDNQKTKPQPKNRLQLPSSVFASAVEEKEGLLNKAVLPVGPQPDWDPEVVAAMDEDFDFDDPNNQIDDDFILQANDGNVIENQQSEDQQADDEEDQWEDASDSNEGSEDVSTVCGSEVSDNHFDNQFSEEETKSHFTNYSMSSSVIRRNKNLSLLDERFETLYENEYANDCEIGALDFDEIEGSIDPNNSEVLAALAEEYQIQKNQKDFYEKDFDVKKFYENYKKRQNETKENEELTEVEIIESSKKRDSDRWDCESILSTYSNLYNRPKLISESNGKHSQRIRIDERTGMPIGVLDRPGLTAKKLAKLDALNAETDMSPKGSKSVRSSVSRISELSVRDSNETPEQRRQRKAALKEYRRERRAEKKANKEAFKKENIRMSKEIVNLQKSLNKVKLV